MDTRRFIVGLVIAIVVLVVVVGGGLYYLTRQLAAVASSGNAVAISISQGESVDDITLALKRAGLIRNDVVFKLYVKAEGLSSKLQAGEYLLQPSMDVPEIVRNLSSGDVSARETVILIKEGWTNATIGAYLSGEQKLFSTADWDAAATVTDSRTILPNVSYAFLDDKPTSATLEGYLYPDTYRVFRNAKPADVIKKLLDNFDAKLTPEIRDEIRTQGKTIFEVVTLASIVEREVPAAADRRMVADVFLKRLRDGIALQSDATLQYATNKPADQLTNDDKKLDSPYNTYRYPGLPAGPIGNPSIASIKAVLDPEPNPYYYFLTTPDGQTVYAKTLAEHNANKAKYLSP